MPWKPHEMYKYIFRSLNTFENLDQEFFGRNKNAHSPSNEVTWIFDG